MEKKIEDFAKEKFSFELPEIIVLPSTLDVSVRADTGGVGSFKIRYKDEIKYSNRKIRGYITCSDYRFKFDIVAFSGREINIKYEFDARGLGTEQCYSGNIHLITDCGEVNLPYRVCINEAGIVVSDENIRNIYQFASYAEKDFESATKLFYSDRFENIILRDREELKLIRKGLLVNKDRQRALEEFLCYTKSKQRVRITTEKSAYNYHISGMPVKDWIIIKKSGWGYVNAEIITEGKFLKIYKNELSEEFFEDGICELEVSINPKFIKSEKAYGRVIIRTFDEDVVIEFNLVNTAIFPEKIAGNKKRFEYVNKLIDEYFSYRMKVSTVKNVTTAMRTVLYGLGLSGKDEEIINYVNIYLNLINKNENQAKEGLLKINSNIKEPLFRLIDIYFKYCLADEENKEKCRREIEKLTNIKGYEAGMYFLIHMDSRFKINLSRRLEYIEELYKENFHSSFLLMEAWDIYRTQPDYFNKLDYFSIQVVNWAEKHGFFTGKLMEEKFVVLANEYREYNPLVVKLLKEVYKNWDADEVVRAICAQLIRKNEINEADHEWFKTGIKYGVRLTGIYELYMRTMNDDTDERIEPSVYSYFLYDNTLNTAKKSLLYSYLIKNRNNSDFADIYKEYREQILVFAGEQIKKGEISSNLAIVYKSLLKDRDFLDDYYAYLPSIIFKKKFQCKDKKIQYITIYTRGMVTPSSFKFNDGAAYADVSGEYTAALITDRDGNVYPADDNCHSERLINYYEYLNGCYEHGDRSLVELITVVAENDRYHKETSYLTDICEHLLRTKNITEEYRYYIRSLLLNYYFEANEGEKIESVLKNYDFPVVSGKAAEQVANIVLLRNVYPLSLSALRIIGFDKVSSGKLSKVILSFIKDKDEERKRENFSLVIALAYKLMMDKKADDVILVFLRDNYEGGVTQLNFLYKELKENKLLTPDFASRFLQQMLFSEELAVEADKIFEYYEHLDDDGTLSKAFLSYVSYKWIVRDVRVGKYFEKRIYDEAFKTKNILFVIAYLKILGVRKYLTEEERDYASIWLEKLVDKGIILPFFKEFKNKCRLPAEIENLNFVVCYADNEDEVAINYRILSSDNSSGRGFKVEWMKNVYQGIFVKEFLVFADETVQYYISIKEKGESESRIISSDVLVIKQDVLFEEDLGLSLFSQINMMYICKDLSDEKTLKEYMKNYVVQREIIDNLFSLKAIDEEF